MARVLLWKAFHNCHGNIHNAYLATALLLWLQVVATIGTSGVLRCSVEWATADASVAVLWDINLNGNGCIAAVSSLEGLVSLAWLHWLLNCEQWLLGLGAHALGIGTVLDVLEVPLVRGFIAAADWLLPGAFSVWHGIGWATSGPVHIGVLGLGLSSTNVGLAQFNVGVVLVAFFAVVVFVMGRLELFGKV